MPESRRGTPKIIQTVSRRGYRKKRVPDRREDEQDVRPVEPGPDRRSQEQNEPTRPASTEEPEPGGESVTFGGYTPLDPTKLKNVKIPVDPSGGAAGSKVVAMTGNVWLAMSNDDGATFKYFDPTTMFPAFAGGIVGDQQVIFIPEIDMFVWIMLHNPIASSGDGAFRLAFGTAEELKRKPKSGWRFVEFVASDVDVAGVDFDQPHLSASARFLIIAIDAVGKGRIVMRIPQSDLTAGQVGWEFIGPLTVGTGDYQFSAPCNNLPPGTFMAGHIDTSTLRIVAWPDGDSASTTHDVKVGKWSDSDDYSCSTPSGVDWSGRCGSRVSGATWRDGQLWFSWVSPRSRNGDAPFFPQPYTRVVAVNSATFANITEMQVWNPDFAFAYSALAVNSNGEVAIAVGWGGPTSEADAAFGILGDFVVWFRDGSTATTTAPGSATAGRWGDYLRTHRSQVTSPHFDGFGYFTNKDASGNIVQNPYHVRYGR